ncbi:PREDICTED: uncharacterized protein LOC104823393 isoform X2 [Tarenaya hassleriana]|uniref:uncharacterized protein LOC104823393 isoform X2 n=1 Tax=Tarenaya hassleriana TaxID=28532 RepID=UPI00053C79A0|nr:PREDICTED: uncharacterized protein LOC104823393 isoform X2 [Tarenaya hassleriana]
MGKHSRSKRSENFGTGKITPRQVAFLVDRYLCDNRFSETRSMFRSEASSLISNSPAREVPKSLMTLDDIITEYICLKEQKVMMDQEKARLEQEKTRVQSLLQGMQNVMNAYNANVAAPHPAIPAAADPSPAIQIVTPAISQSAVGTPQQNNFRESPSGCNMYNTPNVMAVSLPGNKRMYCGNFPTPSTGQSIPRKRKGPEFSSGAPSVFRKTWNKTATENLASDYGTDKFLQSDNNAGSCSKSRSPSKMQTLAKINAGNELSGHGSNVAKCLFNKDTIVSPPITSTCPKTPQKQVSSQTDKSISPQDVTLTPANCTIVTKERITVSPLKQITSYTVERSHVISSSPAKSNKGGHAKGRLDFGDSSMATDVVSTSPSGSEQETDFFDMDFPNLEILGENFSFSELLGDFDLGYEVAVDPCLPLPSNVPEETVSGSSPESGDGNLGPPDPVLSEYTSTVTEVIQGKDVNTQGPDGMTAVKSITKCIRILSPAKSSRQIATTQTMDIL